MGSGDVGKKTVTEGTLNADADNNDDEIFRFEGFNDLPARQVKLDEKEEDVRGGKGGGGEGEGGAGRKESEVILGVINEKTSAPFTGHQVEQELR